MSRNLPYEEKMRELLEQVPLPDENRGWEDMRKRLDEEEDDPKGGFILLPGCAGWVLLGIGLLIGAWFWFKPQERVRSDTSEKPEKVTGKANVDIEQADRDRSSVAREPHIPNSEGNANLDRHTTETRGTEAARREKKSEERILSPVKHEQSRPERSRIANRNSIPGNSATKSANSKPLSRPGLVNGIQEQEINPSRPPQNNEAGDTPISVTAETGTEKLPADSLQENKPVTTTAKAKKDPSGKADPDSLPAPKNKKTDAIERPFYFSAGMALQQQVPMAGQQLVPYSSFGRKTLLTDYIPSVYVQANKQDRWNVHLGFRYAAPQYNKEFAYQTQIQTDTMSQVRTTTSLRLRKSFYHQLPVGFNYYPAKNWSVGAGLVWNKFYGSVSEREVAQGSLTQPDSILGRKTGFLRADTTGSFAKSYWLGMFESQYSWKRFSFGLRYTFGLEPYIRFQLPGGGMQSEKSNALQLFIRYEWWRSGKD